MNKIADLIKKHCPEGVEFKELGEVAEIKRGTTITKRNIKKGKIPVIAGGRTPAYFHNLSNRNAKITAIAGSGAYAGFVSWWEQPIFVSDAFTVKPYNENEFISKYFYYCLKSKQNKLHNLKSGAGVPHVYPRDVSHLKIPIPPLPVQKEIVNILDTFTKLEAELEAELEARRQQYTHYRDKLLDFTYENLPHHPLTKLIKKHCPEGVEFKELGEVGNVRMCKRIFKIQTNPEGGVPFYKIGTFGKQADSFISKETYEAYKNKYNFPKKGDVLISASGTIGRTVVYDGKPAYFQDSNIIWLNNDESIVTNEYLWHFYKVAKWFVSDGGTINRLYNDNIKKTKIPIPPLPVQKEIVNILDKFDALVHDISQGLPAEMTARRQQYEHYRNRLLTFREI